MAVPTQAASKVKCCMAESSPSTTLSTEAVWKRVVSRRLRWIPFKVAG